VLSRPGRCIVTHSVHKAVIFLYLIIAISCLAGGMDERPKIGLVLSGGGARGFAHVGILKMLDSLEIPVDFIAGTSMGGIVGALYAVGYSGQDIEALISDTDWNEVFNDNPQRRMLPFIRKKDTGKYQLEFGLQGFRPLPPSGLIYGQKISLLFSGLTYPYEQFSDFTRLPIPFHCVTVNIVTGSQVVLKRGSLARAMRATMAIPTVFSPVEWGDSILVDGGMVNNLPVDVVKEMGADFVIAVDVGNRLLKPDELHSAISVLEQSLYILGINQWKKNVAMADLYIHPDLEAFALSDFTRQKVADILQAGNQAARMSKNRLDSIKTRYNLQRIMNHPPAQQFTVPPVIGEIQITGYTGTDLHSIQSALKLNAGDLFDYSRFVDQLAELKVAMNFDDVQYEIIPVSRESVRLMIRIREKEKPVIFGMSISGQKYLPFGILYQSLGFKPSDRLDVEKLNHRIMSLYGLGYFESIHYEVEPHGRNRVYLSVQVKEHSKRKLMMGLRYDNNYKLVALLAVQGTNFLIPGLRYEHELQFAGLLHYYFKTYYPSRTLNLPVYPFLRFETKDVPISIYDLYLGNKIARYGAKSLSYSAGLGLLLGKLCNIEIGYETERLDITPDVAFSNPVAFPSWNEKLHKMTASLVFDNLDDLSTPQSGAYVTAKYEGSYQRLQTELPYDQFQASADLYATIFHRHTFRLYGFHGSGHSLPLYKTPNQGHPATFVGMNYDQLFGSSFSLLRTDYRFRLHPRIFIKLIWNTAFDIRQKSEYYNVTTDDVRGYGAGLKWNSPLGPFELIFSRGNKHFGSGREMQSVFYFLFGSTLDKFLYQ
jgi:predicted acylesterase/phospholipase RssA